MFIQDGTILAFFFFSFIELLELDWCRDQLLGSDQLDSESCSINCAIIFKYIFIDRQHCCTERATEDIIQVMALTLTYLTGFGYKLCTLSVIRKRCMICLVTSSV